MRVSQTQSLSISSITSKKRYVKTKKPNRLESVRGNQHDARKEFLSGLYLVNRTHKQFAVDPFIRVCKADDLTQNLN